MAKIKYSLEFEMKSINTALLWQYVSSPMGLQQWFADEVTRVGKTFSFSWNGSVSQATMVVVYTGSYIRFHWSDDDDRRAFFEFKISVSELTDRTVLTVTDFSDPDELEEAKGLWVNQVISLQRILGCS